MKSRFNSSLWKKLEKLAHSQRMQFALQQIPCEGLFALLQKHRGKGRNDYPIPKMWESLLAKLISRRKPDVVSDAALSRFLTSLMSHREYFYGILQQQILALYQQDPSFGAVLLFQRIKQTDDETEYYCLMDGLTVLPIMISKKLKRDSWEFVFDSLHQLQNLLPSYWYKERCLVANEAFDHPEFYRILWDNYHVKPVIGLCSKPIYPSLSDLSCKRCYFSSKGELHCEYDKAMIFSGFEKKRNSLKFRCQSKHYGYFCAHSARCKAKNGLRLPISIDRRLLTPIPRCSYKWNQLYQLNSSFDHFQKYFSSFFQRNHFYSSKKKELLSLFSIIFLYSYVLGVECKEITGSKKPS